MLHGKEILTNYYEGFCLRRHIAYGVGNELPCAFGMAAAVKYTV